MSQLYLIKTCSALQQLLQEEVSALTSSVKVLQRSCNHHVRTQGTQEHKSPLVLFPSEGNMEK
jgi:hypothetical protein